MSFMLEEIHQQPDTINRLMGEESKNVEALAQEVKRRNIQLVIIAARGTSDNAARYGKYIIEITNGMPVALAAASVLTLYGSRVKMDNALVIGISQSGQAPDVAEYLAESKSQGALTAAITNEPGSKITEIADFTILCHAFREKSVAATKTYTSTLAALYLLSAKLAGDGDRIAKLADVPGEMDKVFSLEENIAERVQRYRYMSDCLVISRGINHCTAFEAALKMSETSYISADPYSAADLMHGPIAVVQKDLPCFLYAADGKALDTMLDTLQKLKSKGAETVVFAHSDAMLNDADTRFKMPAGVDELVSPMIYIVAGQLFAYYLAQVKGHDPDNPRGLKKVTLTR